MDTHAEPQPSLAVESVLVGSHRDFLAFVEKRVGDRALAEDLLQEAFVRGLDKLGTLGDTESAIAWFYRVLRNVVIDHRRRSGAANKKLEAFAVELEAQPAPQGDMERAVCQCIGSLATALKPEYAHVLRRVEVEGLPVKDYAVEAGITSNNAAVRVFRAREALRKQVVRSCGTCAEHGCLDCNCRSAQSEPP